jgi:serine protease Do
LDIDAAGPAAKAGLKLDDVIVKLNGQTIGSASDIIRLLWRMDVGSKATLVVKRGATELTITIDLPRRPADTSFI